MRRRVLGFLIIPFLCAPTMVYAQSAACDPEFEKTIEANAWMEAQREIEVAERLILKPDSVLEYTCFGTQVDALAANGRFGLDLSGALNGVVKASLTEYDKNGFQYKYAGGTHKDSGTCISMAKIWEFLKCVDFDEELFLTFDELAKDDIRTVPMKCTNIAERNKKWAEMVALADTPPAAPPEKGGVEKVETFNDKFYFGAATSCASSQEILTGVKVKGAGDDAVCTVPGCYYDGTGCH